MSTIEYSLIVDDQRWEEVLKEYQNIADMTFKAAMDYMTAEFELELFDYDKEFYLNLILTNDNLIRDLNKQFRGKDKPTNVLSFANLDADDFQKKLEDEKEAEICLGEIFVALETLVQEADEKGILLKNHLAHLFVHGILHLLGFDHQDDDEADEMEQIEVAILKNIDINNPYEV